MTSGRGPEDTSTVHPESLVKLTLKQQLKKFAARNQRVSETDMSDGESIPDNNLDEDYRPSSDSDEFSSDSEAEHDVYSPQSEFIHKSVQRNHWNVSTSQCDPALENTNSPETVHHTEAVVDTGLAKKYSKKKIPRPCTFCGRFQTNLHRHFLLKHKAEQSVLEALRLPAQEKLKAFENLRKEGILKHNKEEMKKENPTYECERSRSSSHKLVQCSRCYGFYAKSYFARHKRVCIEESVIEPRGMPISLLSDSCRGINSDFKAHILASFANDDVGKICKTDDAIILFGSNMYSKLKGKQDKREEVKRSVMSDMRRIAHLFVHFKVECEQEQKPLTSSADILIRSNFEQTKEAILKYTDSDGTLKAGLKSQLYYVIKRFAKAIKGSYLASDDDAKASEVDKFLDVLRLHDRDIFGDATYKLNMNRQEKLR